MEEDNKDIEINDGQDFEDEVDEEVDEAPQKYYTEQDIQNSFNAGVRKASSEWQKDEQFKEFLAWKESNKDDTDRLNELISDYDDLENENDFLWRELEQLNAQIAVDNSGVKKEFSRFVTSEVLDNVDETTDFDQALREYKRNNPQYFGETVIRKVQTAPGLNGGTPPQTTNAIMNDILRGAR